MNKIQIYTFICNIRIENLKRQLYSFPERMVVQEGRGFSVQPLGPGWHGNVRNRKITMRRSVNFKKTSHLYIPWMLMLLILQSKKLQWRTSCFYRKSLLDWWCKEPTRFHFLPILTILWHPIIFQKCWLPWSFHVGNIQSACNLQCSTQ